MLVYYWKAQDQSDLARDEHGYVEGEGTNVDYWKIEVKVAKADCSFNVGELTKWQPLELCMPADQAGLIMEAKLGADKLPKVEVWKAMASYFEEAHSTMLERIQDELNATTEDPLETQDTPEVPKDPEEIDLEEELAEEVQEETQEEEITPSTQDNYTTG